MEYSGGSKKDQKFGTEETTGMAFSSFWRLEDQVQGHSRDAHSLNTGFRVQSVFWLYPPDSAPWGPLRQDINSIQVTFCPPDLNTSQRTHFHDAGD